MDIHAEYYDADRDCLVAPLATGEQRRDKTSNSRAWLSADTVATKVMCGVPVLSRAWASGLAPLPTDFAFAGDEPKLRWHRSVVAAWLVVNPVVRGQRTFPELAMAPMSQEDLRVKQRVYSAAYRAKPGMAEKARVYARSRMPARTTMPITAPELADLRQRAACWDAYQATLADEALA